MRTLTFGPARHSRNGTAYQSQRWRKLAKWVLRRDHRQCQIRGPGCTSLATQADHIIPSDLTGEGPLFWDPANLQAACATCNRRKWAGVGAPPELRSPLVRDFTRREP